jgi:hypothetical protein
LEGLNLFQNRKKEMLKELEISIASFVFFDAVEMKPKIAGNGSKTKKRPPAAFLE